MTAACSGTPEPTPQTPAMISSQPVIHLLQKRFHYQSDKSQLAAPELNHLSGISEYLNANPNQGLLITGHADATGESFDNLVLSVLRARHIKDRLIGLGVDERRIHVDAEGELRPLGDNRTADGRQRNRRVDLVFVKADVVSSLRRQQRQPIPRADATSQPATLQALQQPD